MSLSYKIVITSILASLFIMTIYVEGYSLSRWFKFSYGFRIGGSMIDIEDRVPDNHIKYTIGASGGIVSDFNITSRISLGLEVLYFMRGGVLPNDGGRITLHYISIPLLVHIWILRNRLAITAGFANNFFLDGDGKLANPNMPINSSTIRVYDFAPIIGVNLVIMKFASGMRLMADVRFEIGVVNIVKRFRPEFFNRTTPYFSLGLNF